MSPQYRTSPHCCPPARPRSQPQQLLAMPRWPWSPFYLLSTLSAPGGGEEPSWSSGDSSPATTACLGDSNKAGTVLLGATQLQGPAAAAQTKPCWGEAVPGAGLAQGVPVGATGERRAGLLKTAPQAQGGWQHCQGHCLHQRVARSWSDVEQCHPCTRPRGSHQCSLCQKDGCLPHTPGVLELPAPQDATQRLCCPAMQCHSASWTTLGPTASPWCPALCPLPGPTPGGAVGSQRSLGKSQHW